MKHWLTTEQKKMLKNLKQEHILIINEKKEFELLPCDLIPGVAHGSSEIRALIFSRGSEQCVVYWHVSGDKKLEIPLASHDFRLLEEFGREIPVAGENGSHTIVPAGSRKYLVTNKIGRTDLLKAFVEAEIME
jgi:hypothetical protein